MIDDKKCIAQDFKNHNGKSGQCVFRPHTHVSLSLVDAFNAIS